MGLNRSFLLMLCLFVIQTGCKEGVPAISQLRNLDGFALDQNSVSVSSKTTPDFTVTGQCESKFSDVEISVDGGKSWNKISEFSTSYQVGCSSEQTFSMHLNFTGHALDASKWTAIGSFHELYFRAVSEAFGNSEPRKLRLDSFQFKNLNSLAAGGGQRTSISGGYRLSDRISPEGSSFVTQSSSGYKIEGAVSW